MPTEYNSNWNVNITEIGWWWLNVRLNWNVMKRKEYCDYVILLIDEKMKREKEQEIKRAL